MKSVTVSPQARGYSLTELLVVLVIIGVLTALALPSLTGSRRAVDEQGVKARLMDLAARQEAFRSSLGKRRYATKDELKETLLPDGKRLLSASEAELRPAGWTIEATVSANRLRFSFIASPDDGGGYPKYCVSEEGELWRAESGECGAAAAATTDVVR